MGAIIIFLIILVIIGLFLKILPYVLVFSVLCFSGFLIYDYYKKKSSKDAEAAKRFLEEKEAKEKEQRLYEQEQAHQRALKEAARAKEDALKDAYERFDSMLSSIPRHEMVIDSDSRRVRGDINDDLHITGVTKSSDLDALGNFVAIDTETTGLSAISDEIIELTAIRFVNWQPREMFTTLINPGKHIPADASRINHITDDMVTDAPRIESIIKDFDEFIGKDNLLGHNISFDAKFLDAAGSGYASRKRKYYDAMKLAQKIQWEYGPDNNKLDTLCSFYGIRDPQTGHRSSSDALATGILFRKLVDEKLS